MSSKEPIQLNPNEFYGKPKKQRSRPVEEMSLKANLSYGEVGIAAKRSGATRDKVNMEVNQSYGLARENTDPDNIVEYDYVY